MARDRLVQIRLLGKTMTKMTDLFTRQILWGSVRAKTRGVAGSSQERFAGHLGQRGPFSGECGI